MVLRAVRGLFPRKWEMTIIAIPEKTTKKMKKNNEYEVGTGINSCRIPPE
jgi:hypothetical protein